MKETPKVTGAISQMRVGELRDLANELGLTMDPKARKADLLAAIREVVPARRGRPTKSKEDEAAQPSAEPAKPAEEQAKAAEAPAERDEGQAKSAERDNSRNRRNQRDDEKPSRRRSRNHRGSDGLDEGAGRAAKIDISLPEPKENKQTKNATALSDADKRAVLDAIGDAAERRADGEDESGENRRRRTRRNRNHERSGGEREESRSRHNSRENNRGKRGGDGEAQSEQRANQRGGDGEAQSEQRTKEEILLPVAGIVDKAGNQFFLRTGGYLPGKNDAQISSNLVRQFGLRRGDAVQGAVRKNEENDSANNRNNNRRNNNRGRAGRRRQNNTKIANQLVEVAAINGLAPEDASKRPEFAKLTPLYPNEMLRLETGQKAISARAIDLVSPIGKGQRGLVVSPPKAGKTMVLQAIAQSIAQNNPNVHLMVVLVDERPEEVTDMRRIVKGEVIASTFDRPVTDHTTVAELAIERAKRLVELGQDVVVLLDSLTRLARAYNLAAPASGRILSGGVDAAALYPPKKFFGAARNIENGGSLTIIATALVETGSKMDEVIFEEFKGTGNMELRLSRQLADRRIFPAIDVNASGTRREEMLYSQEELKVLWSLRRALGTLSVEDASDFVLKRLKKTENNAEFLVSIMRSVQASGHAAKAD